MDRPSAEELEGMTVDERFYALGLLNDFDSAAQARDRKAMIALYKDAGLKDAESCVDIILANPEGYGF